MEIQSEDESTRPAVSSQFSCTQFLETDDVESVLSGWVANHKGAIQDMLSSKDNEIATAKRELEELRSLFASIQEENSSLKVKVENRTSSLERRNSQELKIDATVQELQASLEESRAREQRVDNEHAWCLAWLRRFRQSGALEAASSLDLSDPDALSLGQPDDGRPALSASLTMEDSLFDNLHKLAAEFLGQLGRQRHEKEEACKSLAVAEEGVRAVEEEARQKSEEMASRVDELQRANSELRELLTESENKQRDLKQVMDQMTAKSNYDLESAREREAKLTAECTRLQESNRELEQQLVIGEAAMKRSLAETSLLARENEEEVRQLRDAIAAKERDETEWRAKNVELNDALQRMRDQLGPLEKQVEALSQQQQQSNNNNQYNSLSVSNTNRSLACSPMPHQQSSQRGDNELAMSEIGPARDGASALAVQFKEKFAELESRFSTMSVQERDSLEKQMEDLAVRMRQESEGAIMILRQDLEHEKEERLTTIAQLQQQCEAVLGKRNKALSREETSTALVSFLQARLADQEKVVDLLRRLLGEKDGAIERKRAKLTRLKTERATLQQELKQSHRELNELREKQREEERERLAARANGFPKFRRDTSIISSGHGRSSDELESTPSPSPQSHSANSSQQPQQCTPPSNISSPVNAALNLGKDSLKSPQEERLISMLMEDLDNNNVSLISTVSSTNNNNSASAANGPDCNQHSEEIEACLPPAFSNKPSLANLEPTNLSSSTSNSNNAHSTKTSLLPSMSHQKQSPLGKRSLGGLSNAKHSSGATGDDGGDMESETLPAAPSLPALVRSPSKQSSLPVITPPPLILTALSSCDSEPIQLQTVASTASAKSGQPNAERRDDASSARGAIAATTKKSAFAKVRMVFSNFLADEKDSLSEKARALGAEIIDQFDESVTHVVTKEYTGSLKVLSAVILGRWIVDSNWILQSAKEGFFVAEEGLARRNTEKPFAGQKFYLTSEFISEDTSKEKEKYLLELIRYGQGQQTKSRADANVIITGKSEGKADGCFTWKAFLQYILEFGDVGKLTGSSPPDAGKNGNVSPSASKKRSGGELKDAASETNKSARDDKHAEARKKMKLTEAHEGEKEKEDGSRPNGRARQSTGHANHLELDCVDEDSGEAMVIESSKASKTRKGDSSGSSSASSSARKKSTATAKSSSREGSSRDSKKKSGK